MFCRLYSLSVSLLLSCIVHRLHMSPESFLSTGVNQPRTEDPFQRENKGNPLTEVSSKLTASTCTEDESGKTKQGDTPDDSDKENRVGEGIKAR